MKLLYIAIFFFCNQVYSQSTSAITTEVLNFEYDSSGNQIKRSFKLTINSASINSISNEIELVSELNEKSFEVYPNPTPGPLTVRWYNDGIQDIKLFDLTGREIKNYNFNKTETSIDLNISNLPKGIYIIHFKTTKGDIVSRKIIKK